MQKGFDAFEELRDFPESEDGHALLQTRRNRQVDMLKILPIVETRYLKGNRTCSQTRSPVNPAG